MAFGRRNHLHESLVLPDEPLASESEFDWIVNDPLVLPIWCSTACCCSAPARVRLLLPLPASDRLIDLFFCLHHFRQHCEALIRSGGILVRQAPPVEQESVYPAPALVPTPR